MEILQIKALSFKYPDAQKYALENIDLSCTSGEFIVMCGESGCGKSTLLKMLKREISPFGEKSGEIRYNKILLEELPARTAAEKIGFVMQEPDSQIVTDSVWHELAFGLESLGEPTQVIRRRVAEMASYFGIEGWFHKKTAELSGGQKQLLNLASVMVMQPEILLLDEPTAQLDPIAAADFIATLKKLNLELGLTVILAEHRLEEVFPIADRILLMDNGHICFDGLPQETAIFFKKRPQHPLKEGIPAAMRIFSALEDGGSSPLTVRDGRKYVMENYGNSVNSLPNERQQINRETVLELKQVWHRYKKELPDVLKGVSLEVCKGEHFCILGGNGTGKSTTLSVAAGILKPYRGRVLINGKPQSDFGKNSLYKKNLTLLPQDPLNVFTQKTLREDLLASCAVMGYSDEQAEDRLSQVTKMLGIEHLMPSHPMDVSGGERQKAALAKLLLLEPQILLLDEPTKGIDAASKQNLAEIINKLKQKGVAVVTVTHDVEFAASTADRCGMFFDGELVSVDTPESFFAENNFYTTAANRISRGHFTNAVLCGQVIELCRLNGKKERSNEE